MADVYNVNYDHGAVAPNPGPHYPARLAVAVAPSDTQDLQNADGAVAYACALYVGVTGDLAVITAGDQSNSGQGTAVTFHGVPVGWFPVQVRRVMVTATTAENIVAVFQR